MTNLETTPIKDIINENFYIPAYQRGYRWKQQQVKELIDDINEFISKGNENSFYCIQPLVVKKINSENEWEVIDGQQRLTTIFIILSYLNQGTYTIKYATRNNNEPLYLEGIDANENIDFHHIVEAQKVIKNYLDKEDNVFLNTLLAKVKFIWYETDDKNPVAVFNRLNIGKIALTNAELIKALMLNQSNFQGQTYYQQEIAQQWDTIEYTLQNDEFWYFLNLRDHNKTTRIDYIFDLICDKNLLDIDIKDDDLGNDEYRTFRYFYSWFNKNAHNRESLEYCWDKAYKIFKTLNEWYSDTEYYHYIGYLVENKISIADIYKKWNECTSKSSFKIYIKEKIKISLNGCKNLCKQYSDNTKTQCKPILLLHNVQTIINQNKAQTVKYGLATFYKFPFHLYKIEKWDVEHIDSSNENKLLKLEAQKDWLKATIEFHPEIHNKFENEINAYLDSSEADQAVFDQLKEQISEALPKGIDYEDNEEQTDNKNPKNRLWNFALLDSSTNRGYGNDIFGFKRKKIIDKDRGKNGNSAFIPICTKNAFLKYYNPKINNLMCWNNDDGKAYIGDIYNTIMEFGVTK